MVENQPVPEFVLCHRMNVRLSRIAIQVKHAVEVPAPPSVQVCVGRDQRVPSEKSDARVVRQASSYEVFIAEPTTVIRRTVGAIRQDILK